MHTVPEMYLLLSPSSMARTTLRGGETWRRNSKLLANGREVVDSVSNALTAAISPCTGYAARAYAEIVHPAALLAKQKGSRSNCGSNSIHRGRKGESSSSSYKTSKPGVTWQAHSKHDSRLTKRQEKGENMASNANTNNGGGRNVPTNRAAPAKSAGGILLCLMEPDESHILRTRMGRCNTILIPVPPAT